jgi:solute carrier family 35 protein F5
MSIFYTNALVGTLGLSLTVPLAIVIDLIRKKKEFNFAFIIGGALVVTGFLVVNLLPVRGFAVFF